MPRTFACYPYPFIFTVIRLASCRLDSRCSVVIIVVDAAAVAEKAICHSVLLKHLYAPDSEMTRVQNKQLRHKQRADVAFQGFTLLGTKFRFGCAGLSVGWALCSQCGVALAQWGSQRAGTEAGTLLM